jgi:hypothetical protein
MELDVNMLDLLPAEERGLAICRPTCGWSCWSTCSENKTESG